jgi:hypothetical protein
MKKTRLLLVGSLLIGLLILAALLMAQDALAPDGTANETYYAPFPLTIALDGDLGDWAGVPAVTLPAGVDLSLGSAAVTFAAAADADFLYFMADVIAARITGTRIRSNST